MRETDLPSPDFGAKGYHLRRIAAQAISQLQVSAANYPSGYHPDAAALRTFFLAAATAAGGGTPTPTPTPAVFDFTDNFASGMAVLRKRAPWTMGRTDVNGQNSGAIGSGVVTFAAVSFNAKTWYVDAGRGDNWQSDVQVTGTQGYHRFNIMDENNYWLLIVTGTSYSLYRITNGTGTTIINNSTASLHAANDVYSFVNTNGTLTILKNGVTMPGTASYALSLSGYGVYGRVGFGAAAASGPSGGPYDNFRITTGAVGVKRLTVNRINPIQQRSAGTNTKAVALSGTHDGCSNLEMRLALLSTHATVSGWDWGQKPLTGVTIGANTWTATSAAVPIMAETYIQVREVSDPAAMSATNAFTVGAASVGVGQSNMQFMGSVLTGAPATDYPNYGILGTAGITSTDLLPTDYVMQQGSAAVGGTTAVAIISNKIITRTGARHAFVINGYGGAASNLLVPSSVDVQFAGTARNYFANNSALVSTIGGDFEAIFYNQGEGGITKADLDTQYAAYKAMTGRDHTTLKFYMIGTGGDSTTANPGETPSNLSSYALTQILQYEWCRDTPGAHLVASQIDIPHLNNLHYTQDMPGYGETALRVAASYDRINGFAATDNRGPLCTGGVIVGSTIELSFDLNGASAITCAAAMATNFDFATTVAMTTVLTPSSMAILGNKVTFTFAAPPPAGTVYRQRLLTTPNVTNFLKGTYGARSVMTWPVFLPVACA